MTSQDWPAGVVLADPQNLVHAAEELSADEYTALCGAGPVFRLPGRYEPTAQNACPRCGRQLDEPGS